MCLYLSPPGRCTHLPRPPLPIRYLEDGPTCDAYQEKKKRDTCLRKDKEIDVEEHERDYKHDFIVLQKRSNKIVRLENCVKKLLQ